MYGEYDAYLIYGWRQGDNMKAIDYHWLHENGVDQFAKGIVRNHVTEFLYGVKCHLNKKTGRPKMSKSNKKLVKKAHAKSGSKAKLGFFTGMLGDLESEHDVYIPNASKTVETKEVTDTSESGVVALDDMH